ncbi:MAG: DUF1572 domain-containing protein [Saprospiraceae bacterium]
MTTRSHDIAERLRQVLLEGRWIANTNMQEQIRDLDWELARKSVHHLNSIALLTFHLNYYLAGLIHVFKGGGLDIRDKYSFDMPPIEKASDWEALRASFLHNAAEFIHHVEQMDDAVLDGPFVDEKYGTYLRNIEGVIEHSYYHFGQIVIIKKMLTEQ